VSLHTFLAALRRRMRLVVAIVVLSVAGAGMLSWLSTERYEAEATLYFSVRSAEGVDDLSNGASFTREQMTSFASLAVTPTVLDPVAARLNYPGGATALGRAVVATAANDTVLLTVTATDTDARRAAAVANAVAERTVAVVGDVSPTDPLGGEGALKVSVVTPASVPTAPSSPNTVLNLAAGVVLGLTLAVLMALAREALDTRVRDTDALGELTDLPVIGSVPAWSAKSGQMIVATAPHSPPAESFRQLRTNLEFLHVAAEDAPHGGDARVLAVTSSLSAEGKSTVAANLAASLAETGARVLLVDADLRRPTVADVLGVEGGVGLTTVLAGQADVDDVLQDWGPAGLQVLPSGAVPPNPAELLSSPAMRRLVSDLRATYDYVVLDTAPVIPVTDAIVLSRIVDGVVVVANTRRVRRRQLAQCLGSLSQVSARVLGVVLNQVHRDEESYTYRPGADRAAQTPVAGVPDPRVLARPRAGEQPVLRA
jgi:polysaccharide biosynthesis transport protein